MIHNIEEADVVECVASQCSEFCSALGCGSLRQIKDG